MNMLPFAYNGSPVDVYFDIEWASKRITNVAVTAGGYNGERISISDADHAALLDAVEQEVALAVMEVALLKQGGALPLA